MFMVLIFIFCCLFSFITAHTSDNIVTKWDKTNIQHLSSFCNETHHRRVLLTGFSFSNKASVDFGGKCSGPLSYADCAFLFAAIESCQTKGTKVFLDAQVNTYKEFLQYLKVFGPTAAQKPFTPDGLVSRRAKQSSGNFQDQHSGVLVNSGFISSPDDEKVVGYAAYERKVYNALALGKVLIDLTTMHADIAIDRIEAIQADSRDKNLGAVIGFIVMGLLV